MQKYSEETLNRAAEMREAGATYAAIGKSLGMSSGAVYWHCLRLGAESPRAAPIRDRDSIGPMVVKRGNHVVRRFTEAEDAILNKMANKGATLSEMARAIGRRTNSVKGRLMTLARHEERALSNLN